MVGRTEQDSVDVEFFPLGLHTWNILNDTCVHLNDNQAIKTMTKTTHTWNAHKETAFTSMTASQCNSKSKTKTMTKIEATELHM